MAASIASTSSITATSSIVAGAASYISTAQACVSWLYSTIRALRSVVKVDRLCRVNVARCAFATASSNVAYSSEYINVVPFSFAAG